LINKNLAIEQHLPGHLPEDQSIVDRIIRMRP